MLDDADRDWLRKLLWRAVCCSLAATPALAVLPGCSDALKEPSSPSHRPLGVDGNGNVIGVAGATAAPTVITTGTMPQAACAGSHWVLAPHLTLARDVDYVADRLGTAVLSESGTRCASAVDVAECTTAATAGAELGHHLLTTAGDEVLAWNPASAPGLLAPIDVPEEALWFALAQGIQVECGTPVAHDDRRGAFDVTGTRQVFLTCTPGVETVNVHVERDGSSTVTVVSSFSQGGGCPGRRPEGLRWVPHARVRTRSALGEHFAAMAHMEAASVPAFAAVGAELVCHGAPQELVRAARRAQRDEVRHARLASRLARRFGAVPMPAVVVSTAPRSLEALALDNAIEGCVNETYAAAEASFQAARAADPVVRRALAQIAVDETRHAALSWEIARWASARLPAASRARVRVAQADAVSRLGARLQQAAGAEELQRVAGVPDREAAASLHAALVNSLWNA